MSVFRTRVALFALQSSEKSSVPFMFLYQYVSLRQWPIILQDECVVKRSVGFKYNPSGPMSSVQCQPKTVIDHTIRWVCCQMAMGLEVQAIWAIVYSYTQYINVVGFNNTFEWGFSFRICRWQILSPFRNAFFYSLVIFDPDIFATMHMFGFILKLMFNPSMS